MSALLQHARLAECESKSSLMVRVLLAGFRDDVPELGSADAFLMHARGSQYIGRRNELQSGRPVHEPIPTHRHRSMAPSTDCFPMRRMHRERLASILHRRMQMAVDQQWAELEVSHSPIVDRHVRALFHEHVCWKLPRLIAAAGR